MVKHIVCFKLSDNSEREKLLAKERLLSMIGNVDMFVSIEVGCDFLCSARSYDVILTVTFPDKEALESYRTDKYHSTIVMPYMHSHIIASVAVDYEC